MDTLKRKVNGIEKLNIESMDLGPLQNDELIYQDDINKISRTLRSIVTRLNTRAKNVIASEKTKQAWESIDYISAGNPEAFNKTVEAHPEVMTLLVTNQDLIRKFDDVRKALKDKGFDDSNVSDAIGKLLDNITTSLNKPQQ